MEIFFSLRIFFSNKNKLLVWESIHPLPVTVRKEQHIYIKITKLEKILIQDSSRNINKLKVKKGSAERGNQFSKRFDLTINSNVARRISRLS